MEGYVKRKIAEKLARFTENLKPADISVDFLSGKGGLRNVELNVEIFTSVLQLPPWIRITRVVCDYVTANVPFTSLKSDPIHFSVGMVKIEAETCTAMEAGTEEESRSSHIQSDSTSKYGYTDKVVDGIKVDIRSIVIHFRDPVFHSRLEMSDVVIQSTTPEWKPAPLPQTRHKNPEEGSVIIYKMGSWNSWKLEGWSSRTSIGGENFQPSQLKFIAGESRICVARKRCIADCSILYTKVKMHVGYAISVLSHSQLKAASRFAQSLLEAAVKSAQRARQRAERSAVGDRASSSPDNLEEMSKLGLLSGSLKGFRWHLPISPTQLAKKVERFAMLPQSRYRNSPSRIEHVSGSQQESRRLSAKTKACQSRTQDYQDGTKALPAHEVIQDSFHLQLGIVDLQLCDNDGIPEGEPPDRRSLKLQLHNMKTDFYLDQQAGAGRHHWNEVNDLMLKNATWSRKQLMNAAELHRTGPVSISIPHLRERGIVMRCSHFSVDALRSDEKVPAVSLVACTAKFLDRPEAVPSSAFQVEMTLYYYPTECGVKFLVPRPNVSVYMSPIHINLHQQSCLWLAEFIHGVIQTINFDLARTGDTSLHGKSPDSEQRHQIPGVDFKCKICLTEVTIPLPKVVDDDLPIAVQLKTAAITLDNRTLSSLLDSHSFSSALQGIREGWIFSTQQTNEFPHLKGECLHLPEELEELFEIRGDGGSQDMSPTSHTIPGRSREPATLEGWHLHLSGVQLTFLESGDSEGIPKPSFVTKFPVHAWVFPPHSDPPSHSISSSTSPHSHRTTKQPVVFIVHTPKALQAELERLQLLFLMRLRDSLLLFRDSFLRTLTRQLTVSRHLGSGESLRLEESPLRTSGEHVPDHLFKGDTPPNSCSDPFLALLREGHLSSAEGSPQPNQSSTSPTSSYATSSLTASRSTADPSTHPSAVVGYMVVKSAEMNILLPSFHTSLSGVPNTAEEHTEADDLSSLEGSHPDSKLSVLTEDISSPINTPPSCREEGSRLFLTSSPLSSPPSTSTGSAPTVFRHLSTSNILNSQREFDAHIRSLSDSDVYGLDEEDSLFFTSLESVEVALETNQSFSPESVSLDAFHSTNQSGSESVTISQEGPVLKSEAFSPQLRLDGQTQKPSQSFRRSETYPSLRPGQHVLQIRAEHLCALPIVQSSDISIKASVETVSVAEIDTDVYKKNKGSHRSTRTHRRVEQGLQRSQRGPVIKGRIEVGDQAGKFFPASPVSDGVMLVKVDGLQASLLLPTVATLTEFFEDEFEGKTKLQMPIQIRIENTEVLVKEHTEETLNNLSIQVQCAEISRGRRVEWMDLFSDETRVDTPELHTEPKSVNETHHGVHVRGEQELLIATPPSYSEAVMSSSSPPSSSNASPSVLPAASPSRNTPSLQQLQEENQRLTEEKRQVSLELRRTKEELQRMTDECAAARRELAAHEK